MRKITIVLALLGFTIGISAQNFISKSGHVKFYSSTPIEKIEAFTEQAASIINTSSGVVQVSLLIRSFNFQKKLMQEHFNENYMESDKFPKSTFKGSITNLKEVDFKTEGEYTANMEGEITIHGVTKPLSTPASIIIKDGLPTAKAKFKVLTEDFDIEIPGMVRDKIAKEIEVTLDISYQKSK